MSTQSERSVEVRAYKFGALEFKVKGLGMFFASDKLKARIAGLPQADLHAANQAAWKLRRSSERLMERYNNVTLHGWDTYDSAHLDYMVAEAVCKVTWRSMQAVAA